MKCQFCSVIVGQAEAHAADAACPQTGLTLCPDCARRISREEIEDGLRDEDGYPIKEGE